MMNQPGFLFYCQSATCASIRAVAVHPHFYESYYSYYSMIPNNMKAGTEVRPLRYTSRHFRATQNFLDAYQ